MNFLCPFLGPSRFNIWFSFAPVFQWCCLTPQAQYIVSVESSSEEEILSFESRPIFMRSLACRDGKQEVTKVIFLFKKSGNSTKCISFISCFSTFNQLVFRRAIQVHLDFMFNKWRDIVLLVSTFVSF